MKFICESLVDDATRPSHPARGAWIEICHLGRKAKARWSHPARGAWIEICVVETEYFAPQSRTPQGVRGLKSHERAACGNCPGRTPQGVRGLKSCIRARTTTSSSSRPARGAWIEMPQPLKQMPASCTSRPARGAWIEIPHRAHTCGLYYSRAPQGARGLKYLPNQGHSPWLVRRAPQGARGLKLSLPVH